MQFFLLLFHGESADDAALEAAGRDEFSRFDILFGEPCEQDFAASAAVALHCGFSSEVYFIRRFRELYGRSPGRYRLERKN